MDTSPAGFVVRKSAMRKEADKERFASIPRSDDVDNRVPESHERKHDAGHVCKADIGLVGVCKGIKAVRRRWYLRRTSY